MLLKLPIKKKILKADRGKKNVITLSSNQKTYNRTFKSK